MNKLVPMCLTVMAAGCAAIQDHTAQPDGGAEMPVVIDFQTGFYGDNVELRINQKPVFSGLLTTDDRIGRARTLQHSPVRRPSLDVTVTVNQSRTFSFRINLEQGRYLGFDKDLDDQTVRVSQSRDPFMYD